MVLLQDRWYNISTNTREGDFMVLFGISISMIVFWLVIALIMLIVEAFTAGLTTIWFAGGAFAALIWGYFYVPETKGVSLEKIEEYWRKGGKPRLLK